jgi:hypothetical protein
MPQTFRPSVVVARSVRAGSRVYLTEADGWTPDLARAEVIEDEAHGDIRLLEARHLSAGLGDVQLAELRLGPGGPVGLRELPQTA